MSSRRRLDMSREAQLERREQVAALTRAGRSATDIARRIDVSVRAVNRNRRAAGLTVGYVRPAVPTEDERLLAKRMLVAGCSYAEVSRSIGFHANTWRRHHPGYGWTRSEAGQLGKAMSELGRKAGVTL